MAQKLQCVESWSCFVAVDLECFDLGFGCQGHDHLDNLGNGKDCAVVIGPRCIYDIPDDISSQQITQQLEQSVG